MRTLRPIHLGLPALCAAGLPAQEARIPPAAWQSLLSSPSEGVNLRWVLKPSETGWVVQIKNAGSVTLHFNFRIAGIQTAAQARENGRAHLEPGARMAIPVSAMPTGLSVSDVAMGDNDVTPVPAN